MRTFDRNPEATDPMLLEWQRVDAQASAFMQRGIGLMASHHTASVAEALRCFDSAFELRRLMPVETVPQFAYGLAACWLNRAEAWMRLRDADVHHGAATIHAFDQAIALLCKLPLHEDPRFPRRLAIAYQNRGLALQADGSSNFTEVTEAFLKAIAILDHDQSALIPDRNYLLATVHLNLANACCTGSEAEGASAAQNAALRAMALVSDLESSDVNAAEVGLKARHIFCKTIVPDLSKKAPNGKTEIDKVHMATDMADEGLNLVRSWEKKGVVRFRSIADDLFNFGARVYERFQPQFLSEFITENLDPDRSSAAYVMSPAMRRTAEEVLARMNRQDRSFSSKRFTIVWPVPG